MKVRCENKGIQSLNMKIVIGLDIPAEQYKYTVQLEIKKDDFHINGDRPSSTNGGVC